METVKTAAPPATFSNSLQHLLAGLACIDLRVRWAVARARAAGLNPDDEFRGLYISDEQVDALLGGGPEHPPWSAAAGNGANGSHASSVSAEESWSQAITQAYQRWQARTQASREAGVGMGFDQLVAAFHLTAVEADALLIALAPELDLRYERLFAYLQDDVTRKRPSIDLILNLLASSFHEKIALRRLFTSNGRLIQSQLLTRFGGGTGPEPGLLAHFVRPAPHVVEHLLGQPGIDERLAPYARLLPAGDSRPLHRLAPDLAAQLQQAAEAQPLFAFTGGYGVGKQEAARHLAQTCGRPLLHVNLPALAKSELGLVAGMALVLRDGRLAAALLHLQSCDEILQDSRWPGPLLRQLLDYPHIVITGSATAWQPGGHRRQRPIYTIHFQTPPYERRLQIWQQHLGEQQDLDLSPVANHFRFTPGQIEDVVATARDMARWRGDALQTADLFAASRAHSNQKLNTLAVKIRPRYRWQDIVLPKDTLQQLREMVNMVRQRPRVYGTWGFGHKMALGKGLNALFAGESGTGKTMAADIMAGELGLDLYKIDLSAVVSKYIGETEKNLDRIFTEAATSNAILFFDEADAIFGKRSEVKDSHDRYANIEISYLLQRMEAYDGVVILATNLRANLDEAFTRRLHFAIEFPFPEAADRCRIWQVNVPAQAPLAADVDFSYLAQHFRLAGGNIRNIILAAAFLAAESGTAVTMAHLLHATRREYQKMGRLIDERLFTNSDREE